MLVIKRKRKNLRGKNPYILFYPAIIANPSGPAKRSAYLATPNTVSTFVPSHTLNRCPPRYDPHHDCEAASSPNPIPTLDKPQLNTVDPLIDLVVAYAKAIHAPNIAFGCATAVIFFQVFNFSSFFVVFQRLLGGRFRLLAVPPALGASGGAAQSPPAASWPASRLPRGAPPS